MVKLTFYGGVKKTDGNKILLEDKKTKTFLILANPSLSAQITSLAGLHQEQQWLGRLLCAARMVVPKLVSEVSDASGFALIMSVDCCLSRKKHN